MGFLWSILIGIAAGWLASQVMKGRSSGVLTNLIMGVIGAILGGVIFEAVGLQAVGMIGHLISATVGAIVLILFLRVLNGGPR